MLQVVQVVRLVQYCPISPMSSTLAKIEESNGSTLANVFQLVLIVSDASCFFLASSSASCRACLHAVTCSTVMEWQPLQKDTKGSGLCRTADRADYMWFCRIPSVLFKFLGKLHTSKGQVAEPSLPISGHSCASCHDPPTAHPKQGTWYKCEGSNLSFRFRHVTIWGNAENSVKNCLRGFNTMTYHDHYCNSLYNLQTLKVVTPCIF